MDANEKRQREALRQLIDRLPESMLKDAEEYLRALYLYPDPVERALYLAPWDDEPETEEERRAAKDANDEWRRGEARPLEDVRRELGL
jgi:hypothetical protein